MTRALMVAAAAFVAGVAVAQTINRLDSAVAAPENNLIRYEDDHVRLLEVIIQPGATEKVHRHVYPAVLAFDAPIPRNTAGSGGPVIERNLFSIDGRPLSELSQQLSRQSELGWRLPVASVAAPSDVSHVVMNTDTFAYHYYRLEFKRIDGNRIMYMASYPE